MNLQVPFVYLSPPGISVGMIVHTVSRFCFLIGRLRPVPTYVVNPDAAFTAILDFDKHPVANLIIGVIVDTLASEPSHVTVNVHILNFKQEFPICRIIPMSHGAFSWPTTNSLMSIKPYVPII